jgi:hypothetical protein
MRLYEVQPGDSPASIAARPEMAGCPKCSRDLLAVNDKPTISFPNGYKTFRDLSVGERLRLPDKWFDGSLDNRPPSYFSALPHPDGVTPSKLGLAAAGVLGDYSTFDSASATAATLAAMNDQSFSNAVDAVCTMIDQAAREADKSPDQRIAAYAQAVHLSTNAARQRNQDLVTAITTGDQAAATKARADIQADLTTALSAAQLALQAVYGGGSAAPATKTTPVIPPDTIVAVAKAVAAAVAADPSYCTSVSQSGSAMNAAIHAFKSARNAANPGTPVPINTGTYEQATADALAKVLGSAPPACGARGGTTPSFPGGDITPPQESQGMSLGAIFGLSLLGAGAVGGAIYLATKESPARVRRARPRPRRARPAIRREDQRDTVAPWKKEIT